MAGESYQRAYGAMVPVQLLAELEEVIQFKMNPDRRSTLRTLWWDRLQVRTSKKNYPLADLESLTGYVFRDVRESWKTGKESFK